MEGYIGEIRLFGGNFAPLGWVFCDGTKYSLAEYTAAFTLLGTTFGGDGQTTFAVPDLRGRVAVGTGQGTGLTAINLGQTGGSETVTMTSAQMPLHSHAAAATITFPCFSDEGDTGSPTGNILAGLSGAYSTQAPDTTIAPAAITGSISVVGSSIPFSIIQPVLSTNYIICLEGYFPPRD
ncbi:MULTISPECIES: phage tail protein [Chryseobacterium]|uniref:Microcystin-dependent protein n=1 Tax=Chryseobacterium camelliae TaxID=1265445 RepID=A0ABU0TDP0_9FLAO|nr:MULTISPECIES: tail fiber protein [Chryseobacterium]MDQ1095201.1 microcystin-dependent protein [Chryseobacterium camelliae]MDR6086487.1 microcystin-dependent protein [Chryseobacterium sp. SORGH_AS_0909]MDR6130859.1 microcystin-dependent protein [Chryseobacterium sp. SORGH_AS_1175]MDT3407008.1 microcystin-dependent protein [Pseudacidovorax intermedius]